MIHIFTNLIHPNPSLAAISGKGYNPTYRTPPHLGLFQNEVWTSDSSDTSQFSIGRLRRWRRWPRAIFCWKRTDVKSVNRKTAGKWGGSCFSFDTFLGVGGGSWTDMHEWLVAHTTWKILNICSSLRFVHFIPTNFPLNSYLFSWPQLSTQNPSRLGLKRSNVKRRWYPQMLCGGLHVRRALGRWPEDDVTTVFCWIYIVSFCTPLKINMEHNHGGLEVWKIIFLSKWGIGRFHVNLPGCKFCTMDHGQSQSNYHLGEFVLTFFQAS